MNNRKPVSLPNELTRHTLEVLNIEEMTLRTKEGFSFHFKRLRYKFVPNLINTGKQKGNFKTNVQLELVNRDSFIRKLYKLSITNFNRTVKSHLDQLAWYLRYLDNLDFDVPEQQILDASYTHKYLNHLIKVAKTGKDVSKPQNAKSAFSYFLRAIGKDEESDKLPTIPNYRNACHGLDLDTEVKPATKALFRAYGVFVKHIKANTFPDIHPLYEKKSFDTHAKKQGWTKRQISNQLQGLKSCLKAQAKTLKGQPPEQQQKLNLWTFYNHATRVALMLCFLLTGSNFTPMLTMRLKDVRFRQIQGDRYLFENIKSRASGKEQDNGLGFSKQVRQFIESWVSVSALISGGGEESWLFPYINTKGEIQNFTYRSSHPYKINNVLTMIGIPRLTSRKLRQTKADTLMKVTEDVYTVAMALNNQISTVKASYSSGLKKDHERNLAASMDAKMAMVKGIETNEAINEAKIKFKDVLSEYDYKKLKRNGTLTLSGTRCEVGKNLNKSLEKNIKRELKQIKVELPSEEQYCTRFLDCIECEFHALVASTNDIWLMLSFYEVLRALSNSVNAINSIPKKRLASLLTQIKSALERLYEKCPENYKKAEKKLIDSQHPLYDNLASLDDLTSIFH